MPIVVVDRPPFFLARRVGVASAEDMAAMLERLRQVAQSSKGRTVAVYDAGADASGRPDARARRVAADWIAANDALLRARCAGMHFAFPNPISRGVLTAILWLHPPPFATETHGSCVAAIEAAARQVGTAANVRALVAALDEAERTGAFVS